MAAGGAGAAAGCSVRVEAQEDDMPIESADEAAAPHSEGLGRGRLGAGSDGCGGGPGGGGGTGGGAGGAAGAGGDGGRPLVGAAVWFGSAVGAAVWFVW